MSQPLPRRRPRLAPSSVAACVWIALLAACGSRESRSDLTVRPAAEQPVGEIGLVFGWPVPAEARVRERVRTSGSEFVVSYRLRIDTLDPDLMVETADLKLEEVGGRVPRSDAERAEIEPMLEAVAAAMPVIRVGRDGSYLGVVDLDAWAERSARAVETQLEAAGEQLAGREDVERALRARVEMMRSRSMRPMLERTAGERWEAWVGCWIGLRGSPGGAPVLRRTTAVLPWAPFGTVCELPTRVRGFVVRPATHVRLEMVGDIDPAGGEGGVASAIARAVAGASDAAGLVARFGRGAVLDPLTLQPLFVEVRLRVEREGADSTGAREDVRTWEFDWVGTESR